MAMLYHHRHLHRLSNPCEYFSSAFTFHAPFNLLHFRWNGCVMAAIDAKWIHATTEFDENVCDGAKRLLLIKYLFPISILFHSLPNISLSLSLTLSHFKWLMDIKFYAPILWPSYYFYLILQTVKLQFLIDFIVLTLLFLWY